MTKRADFEHEILVHLDTLYAVARRLTRDASLADDLLQEAILRAYRAFPPKNRSNLKGWAATILRNVFRNHLRDTSREKAWETLDPEAGDERGDHASIERQVDLRLGKMAWSEIADRFTSDDVKASVDALSEDQREVFLLVHLGGLSYREASETLEIPVGTVMSRLHRAREVLRRKLRSFADEAGWTRVRENDR